jgi:hypothetical protein
MKMSANLKNMMKQEVQHFVESQLIEVMNVKKHTIQLISILIRIQL